MQKTNSRHEIITIRNPSEEVRIAVVAKHVPFSPNLKPQRFMINLDPLEDIHLNFLGLPMGSIDFYCMDPFDWEAEDMATGKIRTYQISQRSLVPKDPSTACDFVPSTWKVFCVEHRVGKPHCIRIVGEADGGVALASMNWWFECPGENTYQDPMYQYSQIFYPTRDDLFHQAKTVFTPPCNPDPRPFGSDRDNYLDNSNYTYTQNVFDSTKKHFWHAIYRMAFEGTQEFVECVGSYPCNGGFWYQKHWTCD